MSITELLQTNTGYTADQKMKVENAWKKYSELESEGFLPVGFSRDDFSSLLEQLAQGNITIFKPQSRSIMYETVSSPTNGPRKIVKDSVDDEGLNDNQAKANEGVNYIIDFQGIPLYHPLIYVLDGIVFERDDEAGKLLSLIRNGVRDTQLIPTVSVYQS